MPSVRRPATRVVVFQCPCGTPTRRRWPWVRGRGGGPWRSIVWTSLVEEDEALRIEVQLAVELGLALPQDVVTLLLGGVGGLF